MSYPGDAMFVQCSKHNVYNCLLMEKLMGTCSTFDSATNSCVSPVPKSPDAANPSADQCIDLASMAEDTSCPAALAESGATASSTVSGLQAAFEAKHGIKPTVVARAPGRVNLIGEHVDHQGYGVLPMAIEQACYVALAPEPYAQSRSNVQAIELANVEPSIYQDLQFDVDPQQEVLPEQHGWGRYFLAAYKGAWENVQQKGLPAPPLLGLRVLVSSTIPPGSGLSSSSALVCASALALLATWGVQATAYEVAEFTCRCERYVGTEGGGMDQAISMMATAGVAMHITFNPLHTSPVPLPASSTFVVANCLAPSLKAESAVRRFNMRVVECRLAAMVLARALGATQQQWRSVRTLGQAAEYMQADDVESQLAAVKEHLVQEAYSASEVEQLLGGCRLHELLADSPRAREVLSAVEADTSSASARGHASAPPAPSSCNVGGNAPASTSDSRSSQAGPAGTNGTGSRPFKLRDRALHVYGEAARVLQFRDVCCADAFRNNSERLQKLGALMDASHASCSQLFECSCPELEELVGVAKAAGALGARLTGAGWGGCIVAIVKHADASTFVAQLRTGYYDKAIAAGRLDKSSFGSAVFQIKPSTGGGCVKL